MRSRSADRARSVRRVAPERGRPLQDAVFAAVEGDRWFERNRSALERFDPDTDLPLKLLELYRLRPHAVLEVGASNGFRLNAIAERFGARVIAAEPSMQAILDGKARFPRVEFVCGAANAIPLREAFDLVVVNFVFHWIDRRSLLRSVAEVDRLLANGGFLVIGDFFPFNRSKVRYHHLVEQELYTYKQNYAATFLASGLYHPVCLLTADHSTRGLAAELPDDERIGVWLLRKKLDEQYVKGSLLRGCALTDPDDSSS